MITIAVVLSITYGLLVVNMNKFFDDQMLDEKNRLKYIYIVFTISSFSRIVVFLFNETDVLNHSEEVYPIMSIIWDILPLSWIIYYHYRMFGAQEKYLEEMRIEEEKEEKEEKAARARAMSSHDSSIVESSTVLSSSSSDGDSAYGNDNRSSY